jgi:hypothetical protein
VLAVLGIGISDFGFVSHFELRVSDFAVVPAAQKVFMRVILFVMLCGTVSSAAAAEHFTQRFNADPINPRLLKFSGRNAQKAIKQTDRGLLVKLPVDKAEGGKQAGVETTFLVDGDFEITVGYEFVEVAAPEKGYGAGVVLRVRKADGSEGHVGFGRIIQHTGAKLFTTHLRSYVRGEARDDRKFFVAEADQGQLRLVRTGSQLSFLAAEADSEEFRELRAIEFGVDPLQSVQLLADSGGSEQPMSIRLTHLSIRAERFPFGLPPAKQRSFWRTWAFWSLVGVFVLIGCGVWSWRRRREPNIARFKVR